MKSSVTKRFFGFGLIAVLSSLGQGSEVKSQTNLNTEVLCEMDCHRSGMGVEKVQGYGSNISVAAKAAKDLCIQIGGTPLGMCWPVRKPAQ